MNFGQNLAKFGDFGHVRNFLTNEIQNPEDDQAKTNLVCIHQPSMLVSHQHTYIKLLQIERASKKNIWWGT